jgi:hypothetical protein
MLPVDDAVPAAASAVAATLPVGGGFKVAMSASERTREAADLCRLKDACSLLTARLAAAAVCDKAEDAEDDAIFRRHVPSSDPQHMLLAKVRMYDLFHAKQDRLIASALSALNGVAVPDQLQLRMVHGTAATADHTDRLPYHERVYEKGLPLLSLVDRSAHVRVR